MQKVKCAVLGATGVVGQHFLKLLTGHPYFELAAVSASDARTGKKLQEMKEHIPGGIPAEFKDIVFDPIDDVDLLVSKGVQIVFSALPADVAGTLEKEAATQGIHVFSNASSYRMDKSVPILIPEVNYKHLDLVKEQKTKGFIVTNANCTTTGLTMALLPIIPMGIKRLIVASYQAISGAGYPGLSAMDISGNVIPYIHNEEPKLLSECKKICGTLENGAIQPTDWDVHAHCIRVPTIVGHLISVHAEMEQDVDQESVMQSMLKYRTPEPLAGLPTAPERPVLYNADNVRPQPRYDINAGTPERALGMAVVNGRLQVQGNVIRFVTLSNNLVRGAAGGSGVDLQAYRQKML